MNASKRFQTCIFDSLLMIFNSDKFSAAFGAEFYMRFWREISHEILREISREIFH